MPSRLTTARLLTLLLTLWALAALAGSKAWAQLAVGLGGTLDDQGRAIAVNDAGNVYVTGYFNGTVDFDPGPGVFELTAVGGKAALIASYDPFGALRYALSFKGEGRGIAVDDSGNVFATGEIGLGGVDVDPGPGVHALDGTEGRVFVVSYDPNGALRFGLNVGGGITNLVEGGNAIAVDDSGNVYITGVINDDADFDPTAGETLVELQGITDAFLASYQSQGGLRFAIGIGGAFRDDGLGVAVDAAGNSYVTGTFRDSVDFDPGPGQEIRVSNGNRDAFLAGYTTTGEYRFAVSVGGTSEDLGNAVAFDAAGNSFVTGTFRNSVDFDPGPGELIISSDGNEDLFLASYTDLGEVRFAFGLGNSIPMYGHGVAVDDLGSPYVTGSFGSAVDFDPGPEDFTIGGASDAFVAGYTNVGAFRFAYKFSDVGPAFGQTGHGIVVDAQRRPYVVGTFGGACDFDPGPGVLVLTSNGTGDVFFTRDEVAPVGVTAALPGGAACILGPAHPNPSGDRVRLELAARETGHVRVAVYDVAGRLVLSLHNGLLAAGARKTLAFTVADLPSGQYFVRVSDAQGVSARTVVVVR